MSAISRFSGVDRESTSRGALLGALMAALVVAALLSPAAAQAQPFGAWLTLTGPTSGYVNVPSVAALNPSSAITIEGWVNVTDLGGCSNIVGKNFVQAYWVGICGTTLRSYLKGSGSLKDGGTLPAGQWTHFAVVYDGVTRKHYINGEVVFSVADTGSLPATGDSLRIGSDVSYPNHTPHGAINEVRLWNVARTQDQIRSTINVPITTSQTGLVAVWSLAATANDVVGGHNGALTGSGVGFLTFPAGPSCSASTVNQLCLQGRFQITTTFRTATTPGPSDGAGKVVVAGPNSGIFWFFSSDNWEVMVKAINACGLNNRYWIYSAATTDRFYRMEVFDTHALRNKIYFNYAGPPAPAVTDSSAFATCP
ncbi:MAG TPA: LamG domain-containing protein [Thermoanaerobaculia bacterium]|nr:LamG domain-containing protein [Thermoanaerobaculia bacterium]